jgi:hypothetical protein
MELTNTRNRNAELSQPAGDPRQAEIARLVQNLNSLEEGERTVAKLMAYGRLAIEPLRLFLFEGKPSVIYQPRRWAVEALAAIGAKEVLIDYLKWKKEIPDPAVRFGEEPVENAAARALAAWRTDEVFETLLDVSRRRSQLGFVEALGNSGERRPSHISSGRSRTISAVPPPRSLFGNWAQPRPPLCWKLLLVGFPRRKRNGLRAYGGGSAF